RDARIALLEGSLTQAEYDARITQLDDDLAFLEKTNIGGEFMADEALARLDDIAARWQWQGGPGLTEDELYNLRVRRGTLSDEDRKIMNDHMVHTCAMLEALPFPKHLRRVPEYAGGHHERMDGKGYPKGIRAGDMSVPARMMAVADVFEALTAADRPYKPAKKLSEAMAIIGMMKKQHHLDPVIVDFFITSGVYRDYARKFLAPELIDEVDEAALLAMQPPPL
ncbi:MAG: phosphohydrolase, partial [Proteobacteria bacterium]|nr:phosphohydrolase [Pseudomonadota bacterium]